MTVPSIYRWDDAGAPQLDTVTPSKIINVLKKCLVDGYGAKTGLGWTLEYEDVPGLIAAFRNSPVNGSGGYVRITAYSTDSDSRICTQSALSMNAIDSLNFAGYINTYPLSSSHQRWVLIGTDTAFYFICHHITQDYTGLTDEKTFFAGDIIPTVVGDVARFVVPGMNNESLTSKYNVSASSGAFDLPFNYDSSLSGIGSANVNLAGKLLVPLGSDSTAVSAEYCFYCPGPQGSLQTSAAVEGLVGTLLTPIAIKLNLSVSVSRVTSVAVPFVRGIFPGVMSASYPVNGDAVFGGTVTLGGVEYFPLSNSANSGVYKGRMRYINLENW